MSYLIAQFPQKPDLSVIYKPTGGMPGRAALISTAVPPYAEDAHPDSPCRRAAFDLGFAFKRALFAKINGQTLAVAAAPTIQMRAGRIDDAAATGLPRKEQAIADLARTHGFTGVMDYWTLNHVGSHGPVRAATVIVPRNGSLNGSGVAFVERTLEGFGL